MLNRVVFMADYPYNRKDHPRFGAEILSESGFSVEVFGVDGILYPDFTIDFVPADAFNYGGLKIFAGRETSEKEILRLTENISFVGSSG